MTNGRHPPIPPVPPLSLTPLEERLASAGYRQLLADYCQTVDQLAHLTQFTIALWDSLQEIRRLLDMPRLPLPIAASLALATKPVLPCDQPTPSIPPAGDLQSRVVAIEIAMAAAMGLDRDLVDASIERILAGTGLTYSNAAAHSRNGTDKPAYHHTECAHTEDAAQ